MTSTRITSAFLCMLWLVSCVPVPVVEKPVEAPEIPVRSVEGAAHYRVVEDGTQVYARVFRGGRLSRLGHNHVVLFEEVRGDIFLAEDISASLFDLALSPVRAVVDPPELRQQQGEEFQTNISDNARGDTRSNMLGTEVLDAASHPYITIRSTKIEGSKSRLKVTAEISLKGAQRHVTLPVSLGLEEDRLVASGELEILQSDFGIEPYSVLGGALKVEDRVEIVFRINGKKV